MPYNKRMQTDCQKATLFVNRWCEALAGYMKSIHILIAVLLSSLLLPAQASSDCPGEKRLRNFLKYHFPILDLTAYNESCSQIIEGDFNRDGILDVAAVLTEVQPSRKYTNGTLWYRAYVMVLLAGELPYNKSQAIFVRTDGNKPKGITVEAASAKDGDDLILKLKNYSRTRYSWSKNGFQATEHSAD